jgi:ankyrin repeat protein
MVELLIANGSKVNPKDKDGTTPLSCVVWQGYEEIAELLRTQGAVE